jgi:GDP-D-mannose dehydratase
VGIRLETESGVFCAGVGRSWFTTPPAAASSSSRARSPGTPPRSSTGCADRELRLGNLDAERDWGYAKDYVEAMWLMLQRDAPEDYVIATGQSRTRCASASRSPSTRPGLATSSSTSTTDPALVRPAEVDHLIGDATKAREQLGWQPQHRLRDDDPPDG